MHEPGSTQGSNQAPQGPWSAVRRCGCAGHAGQAGPSYKDETGGYRPGNQPHMHWCCLLNCRQLSSHTAQTRSRAPGEVAAAVGTDGRLMHLQNRCWAMQPLCSLHHAPTGQADEWQSHAFETHPASATARCRVGAPGRAKWGRGPMRRGHSLVHRPIWSYHSHKAQTVVRYSLGVNSPEIQSFTFGASELEGSGAAHWCGGHARWHYGPAPRGWNRPSTGAGHHKLSGSCGVLQRWPN